MTYGYNVGNEGRDDIWTQEVQERSAASTLHGLHTMHKAEQAHPSEHNGAAMQSPEARRESMSAMSGLMRMAPLDCSRGRRRRPLVENTP